MSEPDPRLAQLAAALAQVSFPPDVVVRPWTEADWPSVQMLCIEEGWQTARNRPDALRLAWQRSWPALVVTHDGQVIAFVRALTDEIVTLYIADLLVAPAWRGLGLGAALIALCHQLYPSTRVDLLSVAFAEPFYESQGFRRFAGFRKSYV